MKEHLRKYRRYLVTRSHHRKVWTYPEDPKEMLQEHKDVYDNIFKDFVQTEPSFNVNLVKHLTRMLPCRTSHSGYMRGVHGDGAGPRKLRLQDAASRALRGRSSRSPRCDRRRRRSRSRRRRRRDSRRGRSRRQYDDSDYESYDDSDDHRAGARRPLALGDKEYDETPPPTTDPGTPASARSASSQALPLADDADLFGHGGHAVSLVAHCSFHLRNDLDMDLCFRIQDMLNVLPLSSAPRPKSHRYEV
jgi:hypothetical protein